MVDESKAVTVALEQGFVPMVRKIQYTAVSSVGSRENQQDSLFVGEKEDALLAVICDGMGGARGGEQASALAVQMLTEAFYSRQPASIPQFYHTMAIQMDEAVYRLTDGSGRRLCAGSTIVSVLLNREGLYWLSVGDSKLYLYRDGDLACPVRPHNYRLLLDELLAADKISQEQYQQEQVKGEALISHLGLGGISRMEINKTPFSAQEGDLVLLCSDGLYRSVAESEIRDILGTSASIDTKAHFLLDQALRRGGASQDNTSAILIRV